MTIDQQGEYRYFANCTLLFVLQHFSGAQANLKWSVEHSIEGIPRSKQVETIGNDDDDCLFSSFIGISNTEKEITQRIILVCFPPTSWVTANYNKGVSQ